MSQGKQETHQFLPIRKPHPADGWRSIAPRTHMFDPSNTVRDILYKDDNDQLQMGGFDPQLITQACAAYKPGQMVKVLSVGLVGIVKHHLHEIVYVTINDEIYKVSRYDVIPYSQDGSFRKIANEGD